MAFPVLLLWDIVLCLDMEIQLVWQNPKSIASLLYILNRYFPLIDGFLTIATFPSMSDEVPLIRDIRSCLALGWSIVVIGVFISRQRQVFAVLRIYALSGRNKSLSGITLLLSLAPFLINLQLQCSFHCGTPLREHLVTLLWRISAILADLMVIAATWRASYRNLRVLQEISGRPSLHQVLLQNGKLFLRLVYEPRAYT
ncbi:hypothetical protein BV20DRAFT_1098346 [Pilatotrama ljubarskyi]|nr:hypothetical protein BV20DRAFT_1098346 [Pilatotrama ljubarskyi]